MSLCQSHSQFYISFNVGLILLILSVNVRLWDSYSLIFISFHVFLDDAFKSFSQQIFFQFPTIIKWQILISNNAVHLAAFLNILFFCLLVSYQTCHSMWSQTANRPWAFWRRALPTASLQPPTTMMPAADLTPSSPSSTHRSSSLNTQTVALIF